MSAFPHRLLIVDDSMIVRNRIMRLCSTAEFQNVKIVGLAANGVQAMAMARKNLPTLVTMDLTMPELDGEECIAQLSSLLPETRILVVSALADKATAVEAMEKGANGFLNKPFTDRQLNEAIAELMR